MPDQYNYTGYFYTKEGYRLRSYLNIRKKSGWFGQGLRRLKSRIGTDTPDVMVVMMNPGASSPLFDPARAEEFAELFVQSVPVILAWGVDGRLRPLARRALDQIKSPVKGGQKKGGNDWAYYHPRQRGKDPQIWVDEILKQL